MTTVLLSSSLSGMTSMNWMSVWLMMEVNTMAMCYLITKESNKQKMKKMVAMKYFLVQMMASSIIIVTVSMQSYSPHMEIIMVMCLMTKMGAWPFHLWYMSVISSLKLNNNPMLLILTWQKFLPAVMMSSMNMNMMTKVVTLAMCLMSLTSPVLKIKYYPNNMIMALSSLNNNSWIIMSAMVSIKVTMMMLMMYSVTLLTTLKMLGKNMKSVSKNILNLMNSLALFANLSGLPPFTMFWVKVMVMQNSMYKMMNMNILTLMLMMSCAMVSLYLILMIPYFMKTMDKTQNTKNKKTSSKTMMMLQGSLLTTMVVNMMATLSST